jgi:hypothetical protein
MSGTFTELVPIEVVTVVVVMVLVLVLVLVVVELSGSWRNLLENKKWQHKIPYVSFKSFDSALAVLCLLGAVFADDVDP